MSYHVQVTREDGAWLADVVDLPGAHTYARNLAALVAAVHEVIELVEDLPDGAPIELEWEYVDVEPRISDAARLGEARDKLERELQQLGNESERQIIELARAGYSVRDIGGLLHLSPGRISQITRELESSERA